MRTAVSWYKNISKINKEEAFTHAHAVHRSYGRGTLPDLIEAGNRCTLPDSLKLEAFHASITLRNALTSITLRNTACSDQ